ncbi:MAG: SMC-Scp complex subunit ScpB [Acidobacteriota bacterium]
MLTEEFANQLLAVLFGAREPVTISSLREVFANRSVQELEFELEQLSQRLSQIVHALELRQVAGGYRITTRPEYHQVVRAYLKTKPSAKLSLAALETLAVIAYKQPVTLAEIMDIRGIKGTSTIRTLLEKKLIEIRGRKKVVGRPIMYGTTREFLIHFGLKDLSELPTLEEFEGILSDLD